MGQKQGDQEADEGGAHRKRYRNAGKGIERQRPREAEEFDQVCIAREWQRQAANPNLSGSQDFPSFQETMLFHFPVTYDVLCAHTFTEVLNDANKRHSSL